MANEKVTKFIDEIKELSVLELSELVNALEEEFGVSAAAVAVAGPGGGEADEAEEQTEFTVMLNDFGESKIQVIKAVREVTGLGLKDAKDLVDNAPNPIKEGVDKEEADKIVARFEEAGATVELK